MDTNKNRELYKNIRDLRIELNNIKKLEEEVTRKYDSICNTCSHDYILIYNKGKTEVGAEILLGYCFICNKRIMYNSFNDYEDLENTCVIDISEGCSKFTHVELFLDSIGVCKYDTKINKSKEIFSKYFSDEYKNYDEKTLRYMIKKDILKNVSGKDIEIKVKKQNDDIMKLKKRRG